jgi:hypothetical protein
MWPVLILVNYYQKTWIDQPSPKNADLYRIYIGVIAIYNYYYKCKMEWYCTRPFVDSPILAHREALLERWDWVKCENGPGAHILHEFDGYYIIQCRSKMFMDRPEGWDKLS